MPRTQLDRAEVKSFLFHKAGQFRDEECLQVRSADLVQDYVTYQTGELCKDETEIITNEKAISDAIGLLIATITNAVCEEVGPCVSWRVTGSRSKNQFAFGRAMNWARIHAFAEGDTSPRVPPTTSPSKRQRTEVQFGLGTTQLAPVTQENLQATVNEFKALVLETRKLIRNPSATTNFRILREEEVPSIYEWNLDVIKFLARSNLPPRLVRITSTKPVLLSYSFSAVFEHPVTGERIHLENLPNGAICMQGAWMAMMKKFCDEYGAVCTLHRTEWEGDLKPRKDSLASLQQQLEAKIAEEMEQRILTLKQELLCMAPPVAV